MSQIYTATISKFTGTNCGSATVAAVCRLMCSHFTHLVRAILGKLSGNYPYARKSYSVYAPSISQAMLTELDAETNHKKSQALLTKLENDESPQIRQALIAKFNKSQTLFSQLYPFTLSWSHYLVLMRIKNDDKRRFYEIETLKTSGIIAICKSIT